MYHLLRADQFDAHRALELGMVQEVVPFGRQVDRAIEIAREICANAPLGVKTTKLAALKYLDEGESAAVAAIADISSVVFHSEDFKEGVQSFVERRAARFQGR